MLLDTDRGQGQIVSSKAQRHPMPALSTRGKNLTRALFRFVVEGFPVAERGEAERKLAICEGGCEFFDGSVCRHAQCGCFTKIKTFFETEHCPLGKW